MSLVDEARAVRDRIAARLRELEPLVREYDELREVARELGIRDIEPAPAPSAAGGTQEPARRAAARTAPARARRRVPREPPAERPAQRGEGELARRVLDAVRADPGKTVAAYAAILGVAPTTLYRPVRRLTNDGSVVKRARELFPG
jgi:Winged helix-turn-helix DNA-binding